MTQGQLRLGIRGVELPMLAIPRRETSTTVAARAALTMLTGIACLIASSLSLKMNKMHVRTVGPARADDPFIMQGKMASARNWPDLIVY